MQSGSGCSKKKRQLRLRNIACNFSTLGLRHLPEPPAEEDQEDGEEGDRERDGGEVLRALLDRLPGWSWTDCCLGEMASGGGQERGIVREDSNPFPGPGTLQNDSSSATVK